MATVRSRAITSLTAAAALALGVIPAAFTASSILATGEDATTIAPATASAGAVVLTTTSAKGTITWNGRTQEIAGGQQCEVSTTGANLLQITGSVGGTQSGVAGFRDGDIGVFEASAPASSPNNASQCFRVDAGSFTQTESLTLALHPDGPYSDLPFASRLAVGSATVSARVANSRDGLITVELLTGAGVVVSTQSVPWSRKKSGDPIAIPTLSMSQGTFEKVRLTATSGSFSVRGATFNLLSAADRTFCPEDTATQGDTTVKYVGEVTGTATTGSTFGGDCFGIQLTDGATSVRFLKPLDVSPDAQFVFTKKWTKTGTFGPEVTLDDVAIDFEFFANERFTDMPYCPEYLYDGGVLTGFTPSNPSTTAALADLRSKDMVVDDPSTTQVEGEGTQFACIGEPRDVTTSSDLIEITDRIYLVGDAKMRL